MKHPPQRPSWMLPLAIVAAALAGCGNSTYTVGVALDAGGLGDNAFNDGAAEGLDRVESELGYATVLAEIEEDSDLVEVLSDLAEQCDVVFGVGFLYADPLVEAAADFPEDRFVVIDGSVYDDPNTTALQFAAEQGSYLVGVAAALKSPAHHVGFIGGVDVPVIEPFLAGYQAGVEATTPGATVDVGWVSEDFSGFDDPEAAQALATTMYTGGAEVVYHAAGGSGLGLFQAAADYSAAQSTHVWAIGVDSDQYLAMQTVDGDLPPYILTSMLKRVDSGIVMASEQAHDGTLQSGTIVLDLADEGVGYTTSGGFIDDVAADLEAAAAAIEDGSIEVPTTP